MLKKISLLGIAFFIAGWARSQELQVRLTVISSKISTQTTKSTFQTLQTALINFLNGRKWTKDNFQANEKIQCSFLLSVEQDLGNNMYGAKLTVQAARPIFSSSYDSPIINFLDGDVVFRYQEFQPIEFNENRIQGTDPAVANLPAVLAYYVYMILGFDYSSFALKSGDEYFKKAWNIVNNAPESRDITGWRSFEGLRNRYWLAENLNNNRFALIHDALYSYYRSGMDLFYENEDEGRNGIMNCLNFLNTINSENPNSMILQFFFQGKSSELVKVFSHAPVDQKTRVRDLLTKLDITNANAYKEIK